jgi:hypothetical protein
MILEEIGGFMCNEDFLNAIKSDLERPSREVTSVNNPSLWRRLWNVFEQTCRGTGTTKTGKQALTAYPDLSN